ncbi:negative elongation factor A [Hyalella azteca]|uniref:Negative elongation factor A n=1 Tax=Hyalella azteca TaxID=294128 RepID=A0A8B7NW35_HYAAZ|nr:negative elongation factor A [Hyalella azteca]
MVSEIWRAELEEIIEVAIVDSDSWVAMIAEIIKTYPSLGALNLDIREQGDNQRIVQDLASELRRVVKKHNEVGLLPMECSYLNRSAFLVAAPQQPVMMKHFNLKRKPKAAALRAELVTRSSDAQANIKKSQLPTVPVRSRGMPRNNDSIPMRGIPRSLSGPGMMRNSSLTPLSARPSRPPLTARRKDGGIKLLDINESPIAAQQAKKRRKLQEAAENKAAEAEAKQQKLQQQQEAAAANAAAQAAAAQQQQQQQQESSTDALDNSTDASDMQKLTPLEPVAEVQDDVATPDYAAGLTPSQPPTPGGPPAPQATPILSNAVATAAALQVGGSVQLPAGTIISRQSIQSCTASSPPQPQQQGVVNLPGLGTHQRIIVTQTPGGGEQRFILTDAPGAGAGEQRIVLSGDQRIIITPANAGVGAGEQRILLTNPSTGVTTEQRVLVTPSGGEPRIIMAPAGTGGEPRIILASPSPAGGEPRILVTPGSQGTILQQSATGQTLVYRTLPAAAQQTYSEPQQLSDNSQPQYATLQPVQPEVLYALSTAAGDGGVSQQQVIALSTQQQAPATVLQPAATAVSATSVQQQVQVLPAQQQQQQKRNLTLTKEQMLEAQEMFRTSNKVTRPEKALILGFMAGSRDNPCPHLGNIVTIKLSEGEETVNQPGGTSINMLAETHFQMNYNTGEWRRIKKYRTLPVDQQAAQ